MGIEYTGKTVRKRSYELDAGRFHDFDPQRIKKADVAQLYQWSTEFREALLRARQRLAGSNDGAIGSENAEYDPLLRVVLYAGESQLVTTLNDIERELTTRPGSKEYIDAHSHSPQENSPPGEMPFMILSDDEADIVR